LKFKSNFSFEGEWRLAQGRKTMPSEELFVDLNALKFAARATARAGGFS
jgi:hypothetical protein